MLDKIPANKMPREIAPGVFWIGDCLAQRHKGKVYHGYNAAFLTLAMVATAGLLLIIIAMPETTPSSKGSPS